MAMGLGSRKGGKGFSEINVTPLVDVMLVLLVVFMVTAPLLTAGLRVELPNVEAQAAPVKDTKLVVTVTKEEKILFGEDDVTSRIEDVLLKNERVQKEKELYIRADKNARYGAVARQTLESVKGQEIPPPPENYPDVVQKTIQVTFVCKEGRCD